MSLLVSCFSLSSLLLLSFFSLSSLLLLLFLLLFLLSLQVTAVVASFDDKYLMTTGSRGGFFSFRMRYDELEKHAQAAADGRAKELAAQAAKAALVSTATVTAELDASMDEVFGKKNWEEEGRTGWKNWKEELEGRTGRKNPGGT
jgi:hypothetical protein